MTAGATVIRASGYPQAEEFVTRYVVGTPTETESLTQLARMEL